MNGPAASLRPGWLLGAAREGCVVVGPEVEATVRLTGGADAGTALVRAFAAGRAHPELPQLVQLLHELGAHGEGEDEPAGCALADAITAARAGTPPAGAVWTAEEVLVLPARLTAPQRIRALRAFVAGLRPDGRLHAYARLAGGAGCVAGDRPAGDGARGTIGATADAVTVRALVGHGRAVAPDDVDQVGAAAPHRLGPVLRLAAPEPVVAGAGGPWLCTAEAAVGNLAESTDAADRVVQGVGTPGHARLVARAEAAERYAVADASGAEVVHARHVDLSGAIDPDALFVGARPDPAARTAVRPWCAAVALDGTRCWVPAEAVYTSIAGAGTVALPWTGSGVAAHTDPEAARDHALRELVERDAFVWTWLRGVSRERVAPETAPADARGHAALLARHGWATTWVNLTLDTDPVVLCCLQHDEAGLTLGAACAPSPAEALRRATVEALVLALRFRADAPPPAPEAVRGPRDHLRLHRDPARRRDHAFLSGGSEELALGDIAPAPGARPLDARLAALGHAPLTVDLTGSAAAPFHVVRVLAPGLLPLTFGWGQEPVGLPRAHRAIRGGSGVETAVGPGRVPHPFP